MTSKKPTHGGQRKGAGRKPGRKTVDMSFSLREKAAEKITRLAAKHGKSKSEIASNLIERP